MGVQLRVPVLVTAAFLASCGQSAPPPAPPITVAIASAQPIEAPITSTAPTAETSAKPPEPTVDKTHDHRVEVTLEPGKPPCKLVFDGKLFQDHPEWFLVTDVTRIATEQSDGCAAGELYDFSKEPKAQPGFMDPMPLAAGTFEKPGEIRPPDIVEMSPYNYFEDYNFDGVADLCIVTLTGAYSHGQMCWIFDTTSRTFVRHSELDEVISVIVDKKTKRLKSSFRAGGPVYESNEYEWQKGKLVQISRDISIYGEKPDGTLLGPGYHSWSTHYQLRNGKMVKTFDGPIRAKP